MPPKVEWRRTWSYDDYEIRYDGMLRNKDGKEFNGCLNKSTGYMQTCLNRKTVMIHRVVAEAWHKNPNNHPYVNHKDGNKTNNHYKNLEWCTASENMIHAKNMGLLRFTYGEKARWYKAYGRKNPHHRVLQCLCTGRLLGVHEAAREMKIQTTNLVKMLNGKRPNWSYFIRYDV